ncbi:hypothetical protein O181_061063 [Austropuccinia psidii MF-1]|uniref:GH16 domain-containing protein n=1 Tax=Austropuccinia psidii MF-1 TaxID=1389203 RepID=A0A9Q3HY47_9BASI|nr:hypothetical protein [Austropuccinia psidii MF-1]
MVYSRTIPNLFISAIFLISDLLPSYGKSNFEHPSQKHRTHQKISARNIGAGINLAISTSTRNQTSNTKKYKLSLESAGSKFFDDWDFFSEADPTHGMVNYQTADEAWKSGLVYVGPSSSNKNLITATMKVDNSTWLQDGQNRNSIRLSSKKSFKYGLLVLDVVKMPFGCSTWPAFWTVGQNWPTDGEIDIVEGVNMLTTNQMTLHTAPGCSIQNPMLQEAVGKVLSTNCDAHAASNTGCGVTDPSDCSYGQPFNKDGGGVFAMEWTPSGISVWRFRRSQIPLDLRQGRTPEPSKWSVRPMAHWSDNACNSLKDQFGEHKIIFDITLCGDWAGSDGVYNANGQCQGTCASSVKNPTNFNDAFWEVASVRLYQ